MHPNAVLPSYATSGSAGMDLTACLDRQVWIYSGHWEIIPTGIAIQLPFLYEGQIRPRSGYAKDLGLTVLNSPGTIDYDYRGEVKVILINHGPDPVIVKHGMKIAQLVMTPVEKVQVKEVGILTDTARGSGGFGSTGG